MKRTAVTQDTLYQRIRELVVTARQTVARGVDLVQVRTNFEIGRHIVEHEQRGEQRAVYGKEVLSVLADRLTVEFGGGFSKSNLEYMRRFFLEYRDRLPIAQTVSGQLIGAGKSQTLSGQLHGSENFQVVQTPSGQSSRPFSLSWSHYVFLLGIKNADERSFYEIEAAGQDWTLRELKRQFDSGLYERLALSRDKEGIRQLAREGQIVSQPQDLLKEPLVLEFLGLAEQSRYSESELEGAIIDRHVRLEGENPTIGIVLCKKKHHALVEITLPKDANIHAREYQLYLPGKEELRRKLEEWMAEVGG